MLRCVQQVHFTERGCIHLALLALLLGPGAVCFPPVFISLPCSSGTGTEALAFPIILAAHSACSHNEAVHTTGPSSLLSAAEEALAALGFGAALTCLASCCIASMKAKYAGTV